MAEPFDGDRNKLHDFYPLFETLASAPGLPVPLFIRPGIEFLGCA